MDQDRFDQLTRVVASSSSRRSLIRAAIGSAAGAVLAAIGVRPAEADVRSCVQCRRGVCTPVRNGTRCGQCGTCTNGFCAMDRSSCGTCQYCETADMTCRPTPRDEGEPCGSCGTCEGGTCKRNADACDEDCERCKGNPRSGFSCASRCSGDKKCCPGGRCIAPDDCCEGQHRCADDTCCFEDCCGSTCCDPGTQQCCGGLCCSKEATCINDALCCLGQECPVPGTDQIRCCSGGAFCCEALGVCVTSPEECCRQTCNSCEKCNTDDFSCEPDPGKAGQRCDTDTRCDGICENGECRVVTQGQRCADGNVCCGDGCCPSATQTCCGGTCCAADQCCGGECCDGFCVLGVCCPIGFTAAEVTSADAVAAGVPVCCPNGPPCGAECCDANEKCCGNHCCDSSAECCGTSCCAAGKFCCEGACQDEECGCPAGQAECPGEGCCPPGLPCSSDGCCPYDQGVVCGAALYPGDSTRPCCPFETETCDFGWPDPVGPYCCPKGQAHFGDGCCPPDKPLFTSLGCGTTGPNGEFCCDDDGLSEGCDNFAAHCTDRTVPGRY